ncbi:NADH dehydrogenase [Clostridiales bacterium PH28_bin88]|nr:NADH dehydrogenase [Clostridiales bacterium PH28_bin88]
MRSLNATRKAIQDEYFAPPQKPKVVIGMGTCGIAAGAQKVMEAIKAEVAARELDVDLGYTSCLGMCHAEVNVEVTLPGGPKVIYGEVIPERAVRIVTQHVQGGEPVKEWVVAQQAEPGLPIEGLPLLDEMEFFQKQRRGVLQNCGRINPDRIEEYIARSGYASLEKVLAGMTREQVIDEVKRSGLRGRGGGGFPTGMKWEFTHKAVGDKKYIVCNADEGDPGAFMDRSVLEGDPHAVLEGMAIAGYAIGADEGYIYCRAEYPLAIKRLNRAISQAEETGVLGENILDSGFNFRIHIKEGAGAFVCGEETALLASIEGERGMPRVRPPFPANKGLWGKPTNINNVETYANIPVVFRDGGATYASVGTEKSKGTKVFAITGKVRRTGLAEVPMGITMREIIFDIGGGIQDDKAFKAVQIGGPSGGCLPTELLDLPVDYDSLVQAGAMMGSGGLVVMDETTCMVDVARFFLNFTQKESCGKCTPCREGTKRMLEILTRITEGKGEPEDIDRLERLGRVVKNTALCGLGQTSPNPILTTLRYFRHEYETHINEKACPARACKELITFYIDPEKCNGCTRCFRGCASGAITGKAKEVHVIDPARCSKCGVCFDRCRFGAVLKLTGAERTAPGREEGRD